MPTTIVNCRTDDFDIYIGRTSKWGNPFRIRGNDSRADVIERYRNWVQRQPHLMAALPELKGKRLGCHCKPSACHGDVLAELANAL